MKHLTCTVRGLPSGTKKSQIEDHFSSIHPESRCVVGPIVEEAPGTLWSATVTFRDEKKGHSRSCEALRDHFNRSLFQGRNSFPISVEDSFYGLHPLSGNANAPIHLYLVHGLGGHAFRTWSSSPDGDLAKLKCWPRDFLPARLRSEEMDARIYTLGYNANSIKKAAPNATITSAAEDLLASLIATRVTNDPNEIYFVCHSLGGLVVCQALIMALFEDEDFHIKASYQELFLKNGQCIVKGIVFMGTPFRGSGDANILAPFVAAVKGLNVFHAANDTFIKSLKKNNNSVEVPTIVQRMKTITESQGIKLLIGCEETPVVGSKLTITYESAVDIFRDTATPFRIHSDHRAMVKFDNRNQGDYAQLENLMINMIRSARGPTPEAGPQSSQHVGNTMYGGSSYNNLVHSPSLSHHSIASTVKGGSSQYRQDYVQHNGYNYFQPGFRRSAYENQHHPGPLDQSPKLPFRQETYPRPSAKPIPQPVSDPELHHSQNRHPPKQRRSTETHNAHGNTDNDWLNRLEMFDTVFIVDDTGSMIQKVDQRDEYGRDRWDVTKEALSYIAEEAAKHDTNGIDLRFLKAIEHNADKVATGDAVMKILDQIDLMDGSHGGGTFFHDHLEAAIDPYLWEYEDYIEKLKDVRTKRRQGARNLLPPTSPKALNLMVITDGEARDHPEVEHYIVHVATKLDNMSAPISYIGIQFVQIGDDPQAADWLRKLDNDLKNQDPPIRDIVDTTPYQSAVNVNNESFYRTLEKALLGAVTRDLDDLENDNMLPQIL